MCDLLGSISITQMPTFGQVARALPTPIQMLVHKGSGAIGYVTFDGSISRVSKFLQGVGSRTIVSPFPLNASPPCNVYSPNATDRR